MTNDQTDLARRVLIDQKLAIDQAVEVIPQLAQTVRCLKRKNDILSKALKWYADKSNWNKDSWNVESVIGYPDYHNSGGKARRALERAQKVENEHTTYRLPSKV